MPFDNNQSSAAGATERKEYRRMTDEEYQAEKEARRERRENAQAVSNIRTFERFSNLKMDFMYPAKAGTRFAPYNAVSGTIYNGVNFFNIYKKARFAGHTDNRYVTFNQAVLRGWSIEKGGEGAKIYTANNERDKDGNALKDRPQYVNHTYIYNAAIVNGMPPSKNRDTNLDLLQCQKNVEEVIAKSGVRVQRMKGLKKPMITWDRSSKAANVYMPEESSFKSQNGYYQVLLNTVVRAKISERLGVPRQNTLDYGKQMLAAQMGTFIFASMTGIGTDSRDYADLLTENKPYMQKYVDYVKENGKDDAFDRLLHSYASCMSEAQKAVGALINGNEKTLGLAADRFQQLRKDIVDGYDPEPKQPLMNEAIFGKFMCVDEKHDVALQGIRRKGHTAYLVSHKISELETKPSVGDTAVVFYDKPGRGSVKVLSIEEIRDAYKRTREELTDEYKKERAQSQAKAPKQRRTKTREQSQSLAM